jgi:hypothetical protein
MAGMRRKSRGVGACVPLDQARVGAVASRVAARYNELALNVSQAFASPVSSPRLNQRTRWADDP